MGVCACTSAQIAGGFLVVDQGRHRLVAVPADGSKVTSSLGQLGSGRGEFDRPSSVALFPVSGLLVIREAGNGGRFQVRSVSKP